MVLAFFFRGVVLCRFFLGGVALLFSLLGRLISEKELLRASSHPSWTHPSANEGLQVLLAEKSRARQPGEENHQRIGTNLAKHFPAAGSKLEPLGEMKYFRDEKERKGKKSEEKAS